MATLSLDAEADAKKRRVDAAAEVRPRSMLRECAAVCPSRIRMLIRLLALLCVVLQKSKAYRPLSEEELKLELKVYYGAMRQLQRVEWIVVQCAEV